MYQTIKYFFCFCQKNNHVFLFQFLDEGPDGFGGVEILGVELVDADLYAEGVVDLADDGNDIKRIEDTLINQFGLVLEIHVRANTLQYL